MVYYFVIADDNSRYGPADIDTLVQWTREGRIIGTTRLIERGTERMLAAGEIAAIAAELRRQSGAANVVIERDYSTGREAPTLTQAGSPWPQSPAAGIPTAMGVPPPPGGPHQSVNLPYAAARRAHPGQRYSPRSRIVAGLLGIFFGWLGLHRFYLGYTGVGLVILLLSMIGAPLSFGYGCGLTMVWGLVEGVICLCGGMRDSDGLDLR